MKLPEHIATTKPVLIIKVSYKKELSELDYDIDKMTTNMISNIKANLPRYTQNDWTIEGEKKFRIRKVVEELE